VGPQMSTPDVGIRVGLLVVTALNSALAKLESVNIFRVSA
jgi:hypothetical protein